MKVWTEKESGCLIEYKTAETDDDTKELELLVGKRAPTKKPTSGQIIGRVNRKRR